MKKEPTVTLSNLPDAEITPEPSAEKEDFNLLSHDQVATDLKPLTQGISKELSIPSDEAAVEPNILTESSKKDENIPVSNGVLSQKEDLTSNDIHKSSRKTSTPAKQEHSENGLQNSPTLPSYMQATVSAKAKLRAQGSPRLGLETSEKTEKTNSTRRHSLPSPANGKITSQSPRTQKLVHSGGKGGIKSDKSLSASRDGNGMTSTFLSD